MAWIALLSYLGIIAVGVWALRIAFLIKVRGRFDLVRFDKGKSLQEAELIAGPFAWMVAAGGISFIGLAIAIPVFQLRFSSWPAIVCLMAAILGVVRHLLAAHHATLVRGRLSRRT